MAQITIIVRKDGPYRIEGEEQVASIRLIDHEGNPIPIPGSGKAVSLCRCGGSTRKPFCDGTHTKIGLRAAEQAQRDYDARVQAQTQAQTQAQEPSQPQGQSQVEQSAQAAAPRPGSEGSGG